MRNYAEMLKRGVRRFGFGLVLPFRLFGAMRRDAELRRSYLTVVLTQAFGALSLFALFLANDVHEIRDLCTGLGDIARTLATVMSAGRKITGDEGELLKKIAISIADEAARAYTMLFIAEWIVIALSRQYIDRLSRHISLTSALPPEDPARSPAIRVDVPWMKKKLKRRARSIYIYAVGIPALAVLSWPLSWATYDGFAYGTLTALWAVYWFVVGVAGKTGYSWSDENAPDPWFLRALSRLERFRAVAWYVRWLRKATRSVSSPMRAAERAPAPFLGLTLARSLFAFPIVSILIRPFIPVAAAKILQVEGVALRLSALPDDPTDSRAHWTASPSGPPLPMADAAASRLAA